MATTAADLSMLDTNVLVDATNDARPRHTAALALLETRDDLAISAQVVREYLVVATRPPAVNGLGLSLHQSRANLDEIRRSVRLLPEETPILPAFATLLDGHPAQGKRLHDAFLVATMLAHGVDTLITSNPGDFERFVGLVRVVEL